MPMLNKEKRINLLPREEFEYTTAGRVLAWLLSIFRVIVITTLIIVMLGFFSRFWLDAKNADLNKKITTKEQQILAFSDFEKEFEEVQDRLSVFSALTAKEATTTDIVKALVPYLPSDVFLTSISIARSEIKINGFSPLESSIMQLIVNINSLEEFDQVSLDTVNPNYENQGLIGFTLSAKINQ